MRKLGSAFIMLSNLRRESEAPVSCSQPGQEGSWQSPNSNQQSTCITTKQLMPLPGSEASSDEACLKGITDRKDCSASRLQ